MAIVSCGSPYCIHRNEYFYCNADRIELDSDGKCTNLVENQGRNQEPPYSQEDYDKAKAQGLDLDDWNDYVKFYGLGEDEQYD